MTTEEIRQELTRAFMNNANAASLFNFQQGASFDSTFSRAGLVSILFYVVAYVIALKERVLDMWKQDITDIADSTRYGTWHWWIKTCKAFQEGDTTSVIDGKVTYATIDPMKQIVTVATAKPNPIANGTGLTLYVAKGSLGAYQPLDPSTDGELEHFQAYIGQVKPLGMPVTVVSGSAAVINLTMTVTYNATTPNSSLLDNIKDAINNYINNIAFGGTVYRSRIVSAVNAIDGVLDCQISGWTSGGTAISGETCEPANGYAILDSNFNPTLTYTNSNANYR